MKLFARAGRRPGSRSHPGGHVADFDLALRAADLPRAHRRKIGCASTTSPDEQRRRGHNEQARHRVSIPPANKCVNALSANLSSRLRDRRARERVGIIGTWRPRGLCENGKRSLEPRAILLAQILSAAERFIEELAPGT